MLGPAKIHSQMLTKWRRAAMLATSRGNSSPGVVRAVAGVVRHATPAGKRDIALAIAPREAVGVAAAVSGAEAAEAAAESSATR
jgi:hypothetical protein